MKTFSIITFGCKANQSDSDQLREELHLRGLDYVPPKRGKVDLLLINTCCVTERAEAEALRTLRSFRKRWPQVKLVATGCMAEAYIDRLKAMPELDLVVRKGKESTLFIQSLKGNGPERKNQDPDGLRLRTRAFLKVQDGCDAFCSYCIVPYARGPLQSKPMDKVIEELESLFKRGFKEVVLTGINLGLYGKDLKGSATFSTLLQKVAEGPPIPRLRLSSIEIGHLVPELLEIIFSSERFCHHFHLPLQSGDGSVLRRMKRPYSPEQFLVKVDWLKAHGPSDMALTTDIMVGFSGETEEAFENTLKVVEAIGFSRVHIFPFSRRPGTKAHDLKARVPPSVIKERCSKLKALSQAISLKFKNNYLHKPLSILVEAKIDPKSNRLSGYSSNYIKVQLEGANHDHINQIVKATIIEVKDEHVLGVVSKGPGQK